MRCLSSLFSHSTKISTSFGDVAKSGFQCDVAVGDAKPNLIDGNVRYTLYWIRLKLQPRDSIMARRTISRIRPGSRSNNQGSRQGTRQNLLEAAGHVFAEKGFERSTAKEISQRAHTNTAAVNYYFGGIEGLYEAVLEEARTQIFSVQTIGKAIEGKNNPKERLEAVFGAVVQTLLGPLSSSWVLRVLARDMVTPSPASDAAKDKLILPRALILRRFVGEYVNLPEDDPAVARACVSLMAPFCMLVLADRRRMKRALPSLGLAPEDAPDFARHLVKFALAGLESLKRKV
jgi:TetR/AcrR family transcriptional regulator, regulator of cefoperazone and chloramphenicol sensitivity